MPLFCVTKGLTGKLSGVITRKQKNKNFFLHVCSSWANSRSWTQTTTAVTVNRAQGAEIASQPTGLMAACVGRRVSALPYHNTVWHTWTTVTSVNTHRLPNCLAARQIMRRVFALDFWKRDQRINAKSHHGGLKQLFILLDLILGGGGKKIEGRRKQEKAIGLLQLENHKGLLPISQWTSRM